MKSSPLASLLLPPLFWKKKKSRPCNSQANKKKRKKKKPQTHQLMQMFIFSRHANSFMDFSEYCVDSASSAGGAVVKSLHCFPYRASRRRPASGNVLRNLKTDHTWTFLKNKQTTHSQIFIPLFGVHSQPFMNQRRICRPNWSYARRP